jgi:hypothetical protein
MQSLELKLKSVHMVQNVLFTIHVVGEMSYEMRFLCLNQSHISEFAI